MQTRFRISTRVRAGRRVLCRHDSHRASAGIGFPTDSKSLSSLTELYDRSQRPSMPPIFKIGRERAFMEAPAEFKVLKPETARRKL
jgi:hypothetical protein